MSTFKKFDDCYTPDGVRYSFDHAVGDLAYVRPTFLVGEQTAPDEVYEHLEQAEYLVEIDLNKLQKEPSPALYLDEIGHFRDTAVALREEVVVIEKEIADLKKQRRDAEHALSITNKEHMEWLKEYPMFRQIHALLTNKPVFFLADWKDSYGNYMSVPKVINTDRNPVGLLAFKHTPNGFVWEVKAKHYDGSRVVTPYMTMEEVYTAVSAMWEKVLAKYIKEHKQKSLYGRISIQTLEAWTKTWEHLTIPGSIYALLAAAERKERENQIEVARVRLKELEEGAGQ